MTKQKLTPYDKNIIDLILRSPDQGEGWRNVSKVCMALFTRLTAKELFEVVPNDDGTGRARLTERGKIVAEYA